MRFILAAVVVLGVLGCRHRSDSPDASARVVLYTSVDEPFVRPVIDRFKRETGIDVTLVTDAEATKTAGLAEKLLAEKDHPAADVYWGNEPFHTINLSDAGALAAYRPPAAASVAARWRDKADLYTAVGLRARMIAISTRPETRPLVASVKGLKDLANPALKGRIGISHPGFGTASGQVAALYLVWGDEATDAWLRSLRANDVALLGGNSVVADQVAAGTLVAGLTDNDDIANARADGQPIEAVAPDQDEKGPGTLLIPTTVSLVRGAPHEANARKLIDFLTASDVERELISKSFVAYSVRDAEPKVKAMDVDYAEVAHRMRAAVVRSLGILQGRPTRP